MFPFFRSIYVFWLLSLRKGNKILLLNTLWINLITLQSLDLPLECDTCGVPIFYSMVYNPPILQLNTTLGSPSILPSQHLATHPSSHHNTWLKIIKYWEKCLHSTKVHVLAIKFHVWREDEWAIKCHVGMEGGC